MVLDDPSGDRGDDAHVPDTRELSGVLHRPRGAYSRRSYPRKPEKKLDVPPGIEWDELPKFHRAVLSAHQVRCEYAEYLIDLWNCIWQPALDNCGFEVTSRTIAETENWAWALDTYSVWSKYAAFVRVFDIDDDGYFTLALGIGTESDGRIRLNLCFWNEPRYVHRMAELDLGNGWGEVEDDYVYTHIELAPIGNDGTVDLAPLRKAAADALAVVGDNLP